LPSSVGALNITMGYSSKKNNCPDIDYEDVQDAYECLVQKCKELCLYIIKMFYILTHPLVEPYAKTAGLVNIINQNNYTFITHHKLMELNPDPGFVSSAIENGKRFDLVLETVSNLLLTIKDNLSNDNEEEKITKAFVFAILR
jgi:hypothetical protein